MAIFTSKITGSGGDGVVQLSGSIQSAGFLSAIGFGNIGTIAVASSIPAGYNAVLYGPITVGSSGTLTINATSSLKIIDIENV